MMKTTLVKNIKRYTTLILGLILLSCSYNLFILPIEIVPGGVSGLAVLFNKIINPSLLIIIVNLILILLSFIILGFKQSKDFILGSLLFPVVIYLTKDIGNYISISYTDTFLNVIFAAVLTGFSIGIIVKNGFSTGGTDIAAAVLSKLAKRSHGKTLLFFDGIIVMSGLFVFGIIKTMYAIMFIYIMSTVIDKIILGISNNKAFYIITNKEKEVKNFILNKLNHGATILQAVGGYENDEKNLIFCVVPARNFFKLKEGINEIDEKAFFIVTDAYEVKGGA